MRNRNTAPQQRDRQHKSRFGKLVAHARTIDDVIKVVSSTKQFPSPLRVVGSDSAATRANRAQEGTLLDMSGMNKVIQITGDTITAEAGARLNELSEALASRGMELCGNDEMPDRTIGGAISSCMLTVGYPDTADHLSSSVVSMVVVTPSGDKVTLAASNEKYMSLFRQAHGLTGIICRVTLKIRPIDSYRISTTKLVLDELARVIPRIIDINVGMKIHLMPFRNRAWVELRRPCGDQKPIKNLPWKIKAWARNSAMPKVVETVGKALSVPTIRDPLIDSLSEATQKLFIGNFADYSSNAQEMSGKFKTMRDPNGERVQCCWAFPAHRFGDVLSAFRQFSVAHYKSTGFRCDLPAEAFRLNKNQDAMLSPSFNGPVFVLRIRSTVAGGWNGYTLELSEFAEQFDGIPLFTQTGSFRAVQASHAYGMRLRAFRTARNRIDPENRLINQFFTEHIG